MTPQKGQPSFKTETHAVLNIHIGVPTLFVLILLYKIGKKNPLYKIERKNSSFAILDMSQNL